MHIKYQGIEFGYYARDDRVLDVLAPIANGLGNAIQGGAVGNQRMLTVTPHQEQQNDYWTSSTPHQEQENGYWPSSTPHQEQQNGYWPSSTPYQEQQNGYWPSSTPHQEQQNGYWPSSTPHQEQLSYWYRPVSYNFNY